PVGYFACLIVVSSADAVLVDPPWVDEARLRLPTLLHRGDRCVAVPSPDRCSNELARRDAIAIGRLILLDQNRYAGACTHNSINSSRRSGGGQVIAIAPLPVRGTVRASRRNHASA